MDNEKINRIVKLFERIINQVNHNKNTSGIDRTPAIKRLAEQGIEILDPENKIFDEQKQKDEIST